VGQLVESPVDQLVTHGYADLQGVRLHYVEAGSGPLVILLHGFPDFWYTWRHQISPLVQAGFHVVAPDMRGYNLSAKPAGIGAYRLSHLCRDVERLIQRFGVERAHIVGHDWGAAVAWSFAMASPARLDRLAILNVPHPVRFMQGLKTLRQARKSWYVFFFQLPWLPEAAIRAGDYASLRRLLRTDPLRPGAFTAADIERHVQAVAQPGALTCMINYYRALMWALGRQSPVRQEATWRRIDAPALVLWGDHDRYLGVELAEPPPDLVPHARVEHFPDASHWLQHDKPDEVSERLVRFLSSTV
jgi:pimeloyl-ACP methyl ester carboxylesterase